MISNIPGMTYTIQTLQYNIRGDYLDVDAKKGYNPEFNNGFDAGKDIAGTIIQLLTVKATGSPNAPEVVLSPSGQAAVVPAGPGQFPLILNIEPAKPGNLQKQVERDQAPRGVDRVDKPHVDGQKPHVHFEDGTSLNNDGTIHDLHKGIPDPSNKIIDWLINNGWKVGK